MKLDAKDKKILKALDENARYPLSKIAKKALTSKQVVDYRIKSLKKRKLLKGFSTAIDISKLGYSSYTVYILFQSITKEREKEIIDFIVQHPFTRWCVSCAGEYDLAFTITASSTNHFNKTLKEILNFIGDNLNEYETNTILDFRDYSLSFFFDNYVPRTVMSEAAKDKIVKIDKKDIEILKLLQKNARIPLIDIAKQLNISADTVNYRIKSLKNKKLIVAYTPSINYNILGYNWYQLLMHLKNITEPEEKRLLKRLSTTKGIRYITRCIGKWNFEIHLVVKNNAELKETVMELRNIFADYLKSYDTNIILEKHKSSTMPKGILEQY
ncbi:AsnC family transcriptional regulator [Candidatus Woesearchaeota archaeon]|nr:AsnC family transcriptional regulator [Candidatus Woesearchaeota archaeon]